MTTDSDATTEVTTDRENALWWLENIDHAIKIAAHHGDAPGLERLESLQLRWRAEARRHADAADR